MLYNSIVAYSLGYSEVEGHREEIFRCECQAPTLATVQALAILSSFHSGVAEQGLSFTYLGIAFTVSRTLCLDGENSSQYSNNLEKNHFSFVLWNLFCLDKTCSLYVGRRQNLRPFVTESTYWKISSLTEVGMIRGLFNPITPVLPEDEAFVAHVGLMQIASFIMEFFYSDDGLCRPGIDIAHVEQLSTLIETWNIHLPASLRGDTDDPETILSIEVIMIKLIFEWMKILLYQPFFQDSTSVTFTSPSFNQYGVSGDIYNRISTLCTRAKLCAPPAAFKITSLLETFDRQYGLRIIDSAAVQIAYVAGRMHLLGAIHNPDRRYGGATPGQGVIRCIDILRKIGETWPSGIASADRLDDLYRPVHDPREDEVGRMDAGSPPPYPSSK
ncbi:uncharacterized protein EI90DRAFT_3031228 [Cantharellus anzutake]|uniref:uncharacterized protein n=1 Tax=Cantharellus anzutake TaxID=1750568 RepID=UPI0019067685|nr:uncharacterized protein EI90DRAFT_3031228 [Cantharellus anzutake]KAF8343062.1 hypothetical protein EI90DRAFT_3031228 [Cantharellus anzutake]